MLFRSVARFAAVHLDIAQPYLADLACHGPVGAGEDLLRERLDELVLALGPEHPEVGSEAAPAVGRAHLALVLLLTLVIGTPATPPALVVDRVWAALFADLSV